MNKVAIKEHLEMLGYRVRDKVTGYEGVVTTIGFDLYGCIQATINPGVGKDGKLADSCWFDIARLEKITTKPVMDIPNFDYGLIAEGKKGPSEKPKMCRSK